MVTWNSAAELPGFLDSLSAQDIPGLELVVVDNGSADASVDLVRAAWPAATVIALDDNLGFAPAVNRGIAATRGEAVALLNFDTVLGRGYLSRCLEALADPTVGAVQGLLVRPGGDVVDSAGHVVTRGRWVRNRGENQPTTARAWAPARPFGVTAAAAVYRRDMLDAVERVTGHYLDPAFFAYLEDVDLDMRAGWLGWEAVVVDARAEHTRSGSGARRTAAVQRHIVKNRLLVLYRNEALDTLLPDLPWVAGQMLARWALALVSAPSSLLGIVDFLRLRRSERPARAAIRAQRTLTPAAFRQRLRLGGANAAGFTTRTLGSTAPR
ncbi:MAG: hypothetical protein QOE92_358 [Chloroflexota bacterium]|nr:hypothetical protein [Chloroflexota bacterium]